MEAVMPAIEPIDHRDQREHPRIGLPVGYALAVFRAPGMDSEPREGHIYDLSAGGMRCELDEPLDLDEPVEVQLQLPAGDRLLVMAAHGSAVRYHDEPTDGPGPIRMGLRFVQVDQPELLEEYLEMLGSVCPAD